MKTKVTLILTMLSLLLPIKALTQDTIRTLIISEAHAGGVDETVDPTDVWAQCYVELTNVGNDTLNLSDFKFGSWRSIAENIGSNSDFGLRLPDVELLPGESFVIANVYDLIENNPDLFPEEAPRTNPERWELVDLQIHRDEFTPGTNDGQDSVSIPQKLLYQQHLDFRTGTHARLLQNYEDVNGDSVYIDGIMNEWDASGEIVFPGPDNFPEANDIAGIVDVWGNSYILVRKTTVQQGSTDWDDARGTSLEDSEWIPIPRRDATGGYGCREFTTIGHHGNATLDGTFVSSSTIIIDWNEKVMTVPWGIYRPFIMDEFELGGGIAWHLQLSSDVEDSTHLIVQTGDILTLYAVGEGLEEMIFALEQAPAPEGMNKVFSKNKKWYNPDKGVFEWVKPFSVSEDDPDMDTISDIGYATRVDTLFKYLEKAPKATWEIDWVDDTERADLKRGDLLLVTSESGVTKEYYLSVDTIPEKSNNAFLDAITWPDAPGFVRSSPGWKDDTIPGFNGNQLFQYKIVVPYGTMGVPALAASPQDLNAQITVDRAVSITGPVQDRTTTFTVLAEDGTTVNEYIVVFREELPENKIQPFNPGPIITEVARLHATAYIEISNPGNQTINLSNYMVTAVNRGWGLTPAEALAADEFGQRWGHFIPGYQFVAKTSAQWDIFPGVMEKDLNVNPFLKPGESFVINKKNWYSSQLWVNPLCDIIFLRKDAHLDYYYENREETQSVGVSLYKHAIEHNANVCQMWNDGFAIMKVLNDSIKAGTKNIFDPEDYVMHDLFTDYTDVPFSPAADTIELWENKYRYFDFRRKSEFWEADSLPGNQGSWADTDEDSEWLNITPGDMIAEGKNEEDILRNIGLHFFEEQSFYKSTITSYQYKVSDGYITPQTIVGVVTGTTVEDFIGRINKEDIGQNISIIGKTATDILEDGDTLEVISADLENKTKYVLSVANEGLSSDAALVAKGGSGYVINYEGVSGSISGITFGSSIVDVLENISEPEGSKLNVIDENNNLVPLQIRIPGSQMYKETSAGSDIYFEVIAEDGVTEVTYQLQINVSDDDAYLYSDIYDVDQQNYIVSSIPQETNVSTFLTYLKSNEGASMMVVDKTGVERKVGDVKFDDQVIVTSADGSKKKIYFLQFIGERMGTDAYVISEILSVDQVENSITGIDANTRLESLLGLVIPAPQAVITVFDVDTVPVGTGEIINSGYKLQVTSGDGMKVKTYDLFLFNVAPVVTVAFADSNILIGETISLVATAEDDGQPEPASLTYTWTVKTGNAENVSIATADQLATDVTFDASGVFTLQISVSDGALTTTDFITIGVSSPGNESPSVSVAFSDTTIERGATINVSCIATDDGNPSGSTLSYEWVVKTGIAANVTIASADQLNSDVTFNEEGVFTLQVIVSDGELISSEIIVVVVTQSVAIEDILTPDLLMYPNPVSHILTLEMINLVDETSVFKLFNIAGQVIFNSEFTESKIEIDISNLDAGLYFVAVKSGNFATTRKLQILK